MRSGGIKNLAGSSTKSKSKDYLSKDYLFGIWYPANVKTKLLWYKLIGNKLFFNETPVSLSYEEFVRHFLSLP